MPTLGRQSVNKQEVSAIKACPSCGQNVPDSTIRCSCGGYLFPYFNSLSTLLRMMRFPLGISWFLVFFYFALMILDEGSAPKAYVVFFLSIVPLMVWMRSKVLRNLSWRAKVSHFTPYFTTAQARLRVIIIVYCLSVVFACIYVPWKVQWRAGQLSCDYSWIWSPAYYTELPVVDYARVILEIVALTALGAIGLTLSGDTWKRGKKEIDLTQDMEKKK